MENDVLTKAVEWYDPDTADTVRLACEERGLELLFLAPTGREYEALAVVRGPSDKVNQFAEDVEEGEADPYEAETRGLSDEEYEAWLQEKLAALGISYEKKTFEALPEEDDEV